jgi:hypothetical protein
MNIFYKLALLHSLVVWGIILIHLVVQVATLKTVGNMGGFFIFIPKKYVGILESVLFMTIRRPPRAY